MKEIEKKSTQARKSLMGTENWLMRSSGMDKMFVNVLDKCVTSDFFLPMKSNKLDCTLKY